MAPVCHDKLHLVVAPILMVQLEGPERTVNLELAADLIWLAAGGAAGGLCSSWVCSRDSA